MSIRADFLKAIMNDEQMNDEQWDRHLKYELLRNQSRILNHLEKIMTAIDNLNANLAKLSSDVDALIAKAATGVPEAQVQSAADALASVDAKVVAATTTP